MMDKQAVLPFPNKYLVECGFSAIISILTKKQKMLSIWAQRPLS